MIHAEEAPEKSIKTDGELKHNLKTSGAISDTKSNFIEKVTLSTSKDKRRMLPTITYFNRTVKVLMEALSGVEPKHLHLRVKRQRKVLRQIKESFLVKMTGFTLQVDLD